MRFYSAADVQRARDHAMDEWSAHSLRDALKRERRWRRRDIAILWALVVLNLAALAGGALTGRPWAVLGAAAAMPGIVFALTQCTARLAVWYERNPELRPDEGDSERRGT